MNNKSTKTGLKTILLTIFSVLYSGCTSVHEFHLYNGDTQPKPNLVRFRYMIPQGVAERMILISIDERLWIKEGVKTPWTNKHINWGTYKDVIFLNPGNHFIKLQVNWSDYLHNEPFLDYISVYEIEYAFIQGHQYVVQCFECPKGNDIHESDLKIYSSEQLARFEDYGVLGGGAVIGLAPILFPVMIVMLATDDSSVEIMERYVWMIDETSSQVVWGNRPKVRNGKEIKLN